MSHFLLFYDLASDYLGRRPAPGARRFATRISRPPGPRSSVASCFWAARSAIR